MTSECEDSSITLFHDVSTPAFLDLDLCFTLAYTWIIPTPHSKYHDALVRLLLANKEFCFSSEGLTCSLMTDSIFPPYKLQHIKEKWAAASLIGLVVHCQLICMFHPYGVLCVFPNFIVLHQFDDLNNRKYVQKSSQSLKRQTMHSQKSASIFPSTPLKHTGSHSVYLRVRWSA